MSKQLAILHQDEAQQKEKNQDKVVIKDVATILSTTGIESLATLPKKLSYPDNSPLVNCM